MNQIAIMPDVLLPSQVARRYEHAGWFRLLCEALLEDAMRCLSSPKPYCPQASWRIAQEARQWVLSDDATFALSFVNVCETLDFSVSAVRAEFLRRNQGAFPAEPPPSRRAG